MPLRESIFDAPHTAQHPQESSPHPDRHRPDVRRSARRRFRSVVARPNAATPRGFSLSILPLGGI
jgi:hypothetical protein